MFGKKKKEPVKEPVVVTSELTPNECDRGIECDKCPERFRCWTERTTKYQPEILKLKEELTLIEEELTIDNLKPRINALNDRKTAIYDRLDGLDKINTIVGTLGSMEQVDPPGGWHAGMISSCSTSGIVDKKVGHAPDSYRFIARVPKNVIDIHNNLIQNFSEGNIVVWCNTKEVYKKWNAKNFEAKLFLLYNNHWYHLVSWNGEKDEPL